jgi:hypothetical protein
MPNSQNGWPVVPRSSVDEKPLIRDVKVPNGVLAGDVAVIFRWLAEQYDRRVEPLRAGWCWGWFVKSIEGSSTISNHASGTAVDLNAPDNPMGVPTSKVMTAAQIKTCHAIEDESDDVLRWGGDYVTRPDAMHWEIVGSRAAVKKLADKIRGAKPTPPREVQTMKLSVTLPVLKQGDDDAKLPGYNMITRMQRIIGTDDDGKWGPATTQKIAEWCKLPTGQCRTLTEVVARKVFGLDG